MSLEELGMFENPKPTSSMASSTNSMTNRDSMIVMDSDEEELTSTDENMPLIFTTFTKRMLKQAESDRELMTLITLAKEGNSWVYKGDYIKANEQYTKLLDEHEEHKEQYSKLFAVIYGNRAMTGIQMKNYEAALPDCLKSIKCNPEQAKSYLMLVLCSNEISKNGNFRDQLISFGITLGADLQSFYKGLISILLKIDDEMKNISRDLSETNRFDEQMSICISGARLQHESLKIHEDMKRLINEEAPRKKRKRHQKNRKQKWRLSKKRQKEAALRILNEQMNK